MAKLFTPCRLGDAELKNRIVMSPMCTYSCLAEDGVVTDWHIIHYGARAVGQAGMIIVEATAVDPRGRISKNDLGLWSDGQVEGMAKQAETIKSQGCVAAIQLNHAGRKAGLDEAGLAPSAIAFSDKYPLPRAMTEEEIHQAAAAFGEAARRAREAGFQAVEIHAAHGYLINQFLSPLTNRREDSYGGSPENRYRFLAEVIDAVKAVWTGPLMVRISAEEYHPQGNHPEDYLYAVERMRDQGVDLLDCSSGAVVPVDINPFPGYQIPYAEFFRHKTGIATGAVGLITSPLQAEEIVANQRADLVLLGRELLRNPNWPLYAARELGAELEIPYQYRRAWQ